MRLVIGLGNPGDRYMNNKRNIGFKVVDILANNMNIQIKTKKKKSLLGIGDFEGQQIVLLKPQTFIELSGEAVLYIASFLRIPIKNIIVAHDDHNLEFGDVQVSLGPIETKSVGLESIVNDLKSDQFARIRIGIGPIPSKGKEPTDDEIEEFVSSDFSLEQNLDTIEIINDAEAALRSILTQDINDVLFRYKIGSTLKGYTAKK